MAPISRIESICTNVWTKIIGGLRAQARNAYYRELCLAKRILCPHIRTSRSVVHSSELPDVCRMCATSKHAEIMALMSGDGGIFRVPMTTFQRWKRQGGWDVINDVAKSRVVIYVPLQSQGKDAGTPIADWLRTWFIHATSTNSYPRYYYNTSTYGIPSSIHVGPCLHCPEQQTKALKARRRLIYVTLQTLLSEMPEPAEMRVMRLWPNTDWATVWRKLQDTPVAEETKVIWYRIIHEIVPRHERLHRIRMIPTDTGRHCNKTDNLLHRLTECVEGPLIWKWTQHRQAQILRIDRRRIPEDRLLRPNLTLSPPKLHRIVLWILANFIMDCLQEKH